MPDFIDIGANLADASFANDLDAVLARAHAVGVSRIVVTGSSIDSNARAYALSQSHDGLFATAGVHPHHADHYDAQMHQQLALQMARPGVIAAGECGLDYFRNLAERDAQARAFRAQLELAAEHALPVFLHQRDAHDDFLALLQPFLPDLPRAVAHCFTAGERELEAYLEAGLYIGITGWICDERRGQHLVPLMARIPDDRLLLETDAPYLLPRTLRPRPKTRRNEPQWLPVIAETVAAARGESVDALAALTTRNAERFFGLSPTPSG